MIRVVNIALTLLAIFGGIVAFRESWLNRELLDEHRTLVAESGYLVPSDPTKVYVVALPSEVPFLFRWRVYLPSKSTVLWKENQWDSHSTSGPEVLTVQIRLREEDNGFVYCFRDFTSYPETESHRWQSMFVGNEMRDFLHDHADDIDIHQLGSDGPVALDPQEIATLLRLQWPKEIADKAEMTLPTWCREYIPDLYVMRFGTEEAFQKTAGSADDGENTP